MRTQHVWWSWKDLNYNPWWTCLWLIVPHTRGRKFWSPDSSRPRFSIHVMINFLLFITSKTFFSAFMFSAQCNHTKDSYFRRTHQPLLRSNRWFQNLNFFGSQDWWYWRSQVSFSFCSIIMSVHCWILLVACIQMVLSVPGGWNFEILEKCWIRCLERGALDC